MIGTLLDAVHRINDAGAAGEESLNRQHEQNVTWLHKQIVINDQHQSQTKDSKSKSAQPSLSMFPRADFIQNSQKMRESRSSHSNLIINKQSPNYSDLVRNSTDFLRNIITSLQAKNEPYELSDWEDEDAMKPMELDLDAEVVNGKQIPSWACGQQLAMAVARQNQIDGDRIFHDLPRRVNIVDLFGTNVFAYYQRMHH